MKKKDTYYKQEKFAEYLILRGYSKSSQHGLKANVKAFSLWVVEQNMKMKTVRYNDIVAYADHRRKKGNSPRFMQHIINAIKQYYNFLIHEDELKENPCTNVLIKGVKRRILHETFTPEELDFIYQTYSNTPIPSGGIGRALCHKRNKIMLGLIIYQGVKTEELARLTLSDVKIKEGKIQVSGGRRINPRELSLEAHQLFDMMDYINETRKVLLILTGRNCDTLFLSMGTGGSFHNMIDRFTKQIYQQDKRIKSLQQLRTSVIANWLKKDNIRKVQYKSGHRYLGSTESYKVNNMDNLKDDISRYHPDI